MLQEIRQYLLKKDEYFIADLIGLSVIREDNGEVLGELTDVLQTGANDVYEVKMEDGKEVFTSSDQRMH